MLRVTSCIHRNKVSWCPTKDFCKRWTPEWKEEEGCWFVESEYVDGWGGRRHMEFCSQNGFQSPEKKESGQPPAVRIAQLQNKQLARPGHCPGHEPGSVSSFIGWL